MKNLFQITKPKPFKKPIQQVKKTGYKRKPTPLEKHDPYAGICRIFPSYVKDNYEYFELLTAPAQKLKDWDGYIRRLKQKIICMKSEFLL